MVARRRDPSVARSPAGRGDGVGEPLDPLLAVLAVAGDAVHRSVPRRATASPRTSSIRGTRSSTPRSPRSALRCGRPATARRTSGSGTSPGPSTPTWRRTASATGKATTATSWAGPAPACTSTRSSPPTPPPWLGAHALGDDQPWFLSVASGEPARRDVVSDRPAVVPGRASRRGRVRAPHPRSRPVEGRRDPPALHRRLPRGVERAAGELRRRPAHQTRDPTAMALGPAARVLGLHRPRRHEGVAPPLGLLRRVAAPSGPEPRCGARRARGGRRLGRHRRAVHLGSRRHVRLARPAIERAVRVRRDHAGAALRPGAGSRRPDR